MEQGDEELSYSKRRRSTLKIASIIAAIIILLLIGLFWWVSSRTDNQNAGSQTGSEQQQVARQLSFIPDDPKPTVETEDFSDYHNTEYFFDDVADDAAIWANPDEPAESLVIANNKAREVGGIAVFDMQGKRTHYEEIASIGNVDLRNDFELAGEKITLVGANDQTNSVLVLRKLNPETKELEAIETDGALKTISVNYGFCMYRSTNTGKYYALVTQDDKGVAEQYEIKDVAGKIGIEKVRMLEIDSEQAEGCVFDDELSKLYIAAEDGAIWQYGAEPGAGNERRKIDDVDGKNLTADIEGLTIAHGPDGSGYLIASSQGSSSYAMYDRQSGDFIRSFKVGGNGDIDAVSETDGLDVTTANLGPGFEYGALIVHDHANQGDKTSNLKYIPLVTQE